ncbi:MAG: hypothetical protein AB7E52_00225 [Bdellovibrionales bacterium]
MNDADVSVLACAFFKAYFTQPFVLILIVLLVLAVGVSLRFCKLEAKIKALEND